jgi:hypothetical protein
MLMPPIHGTCNQSNFYIYAACDTQYFDEFGQAFIRSIKHNTTAGVHIHLFNAEQRQIETCYNLGATVTWESVPLELFAPAERNQLHPTELDRTQNAMSKGGDRNLLERMQKTYYACARFVRLQELFNPTVTTLELDIDAVVRRDIPRLEESCDFYIHHITGKKARFLAGGLYLTANSRSPRFLLEYADQLKQYIERDYLYWGLDQDLLDPIVPKYNHHQLPMEYIDWNMQPNSYVWTAKGTRKDLEIFKNEQRKYTS